MLYDNPDVPGDMSGDSTVGKSKDMPILKASHDRSDSRMGGRWTWEEPEAWDHPLNKPAGGGWGNPPTSKGGGPSKKTDPKKRIKDANDKAMSGAKKKKTSYKGNLEKLKNL